MTRTSTINVEVPEGQQMDRSNDPQVTEALDAAAPELAMRSRKQAFAGSADGVGSVGFNETGAYDVGAGETAEPRDTGAAPETTSFDPGDDAERDRVRAGGVGPGGETGPDPRSQRLQERQRFGRPDASQEPLSGGKGF